MAPLERCGGLGLRHVDGYALAAEVQRLEEARAALALTLLHLVEDPSAEGLAAAGVACGHTHTYIYI